MTIKENIKTGTVKNNCCTLVLSEAWALISVDIFNL